jgi:SAM-dependent methyltransferase
MPAAGYGSARPSETAGAARAWWDADAEAYHAEHGAFLGDADLVWCPEGVREDAAALLGDVGGRDVLEVGCGGGQGARWASGRGARAVGLDISAGMLAVARRLAAPAASAGTMPALVQADARALPFADAVFDVAFSAFGALPFVERLADVDREVARVLRPGGRWVYSAVHPLRWCFPDDPTRRGLTVERSYFDPRAYTEREGGRLVYAEFPHPFAEHVGALRDAGLTLTGMLEPEWPAGGGAVWGAWGPERGALIPGTLIVSARKD